MSLTPPDATWYMDTGATNHRTLLLGTLSSYFNMSNHNSIIVGSGDQILVLGHGDSILSLLHPPLILKNVLHASGPIKNLFSVCCFTIDNNVTVEFDCFGFFMKDILWGDQS